MKEGSKMPLKDTLKQPAGVNKQSPYVKNHFYMTNMKASIYMSVIVIVLELWMIERMIKTIFEKDLGSKFWELTESYFSNYFMLLSAGLLMLLFALRALFNTRKTRWLAVAVIIFSAAVAVFEARMIISYGGSSKTAADLSNYIILFSASLVMVFFAVVLILNRWERKWHSLCVMYVFSFCCINFGIIMSVHSFAKGDQILTFLTMELFSMCLLTWKPLAAFLISGGSYLYFFLRINDMVAVNTGEQGTTIATQINFFTMWISTMMVCVANYNNTRLQAIKDENLEKINAYLSKISVEDELTGIHNMVYFRSEGEKLLNYVTTDKENILFLFFDIENFKSYNEKYSFQAGNELLKKIAHMIEDEFEGSLVSRFSDDHFVVLTSVDGAQNKIGQLSGEIKKLQKEVHLELKCGAYKPTDDKSDISQACDRARFACNSIKKHYDRTLRFYDKSLEDKFQQKQYIVNNIDTAIENGWIKVFYQPVVDTSDGSICGLEALARWQDPNYGLTSSSGRIHRDT